MSDKRKSLHNALIQPKIQSVQIRSIRVISVQKKAKTPFHSLTLCERHKKESKAKHLELPRGKTGIRSELSSRGAKAEQPSRVRILSENENAQSFHFERLKRKDRDSNPGSSVTRLPHFECGPFDHSGIFPQFCGCEDSE